MTSVPQSIRRVRQKNFVIVTVALVGTLIGFGPERAKAITNANPTTSQPWVVGLVFRKTSTGDQNLCTGFSLSRHWIVTSAHCLAGRSYQTDTVSVYRDIASTSASSQDAVYSGKASYYNNPDYGGDGDRGDDLGLVRLRGDGMIPELTAKIHNGPRVDPRQDPRLPPSQREPPPTFFVAGLGKGTDAGGSNDCDSPSAVAGQGKKRIGRFVLSGTTDDNGSLGFGNPIAIEAWTRDNELCGSDSGAPWAFAVGDDPANEWHVFGVHSGHGKRFSFGDDDWSTLLRPKMEWVTDIAASKDVALACPGFGEPGKPGSYRRCTEGYWMVSSAAADAKARRFHPTSTNLAAVHFGDFDGDGHKADAFVSSPNGDNYVLYSDAVEWRRVTDVVPGQPLQFGDFDGDGVTDVLKQGGGNWYVIFAQRDRTTPWGNAVRVGTSDVPPNKLAVGDFDGDGVADVLGSTGGFLRVSFGTKDRTAWSRWIRLQDSDDSISQLRVADFDGDGVSDVFRIDDKHRWQISYSTRDRTVHWAQWITVNSSTRPLDLLGFGDFDGNGATDVLRSTGGEWSVSYATRNRTRWSQWTAINRSSVAVPSLSFAYVDGDRKSDAIFVAPVEP